MFINLYNCSILLITHTRISVGSSIYTANTSEFIYNSTYGMQWMQYILKTVKLKKSFLKTYINILLLYNSRKQNFLIDDDMQYNIE